VEYYVCIIWHQGMVNAVLVTSSFYSHPQQTLSFAAVSLCLSLSLDVYYYMENDSLCNRKG